MTLIKLSLRFDGDELVLPLPSGREVRLPAERSRIEGLRLAKREGDEAGGEMWIQLDPTAYVITMCQFYAAQQGLPQPRSLDGEAIESWFRQIVAHVERVPVGDAWADFIMIVLNESPSPNPPEAA